MSVLACVTGEPVRLSGVRMPHPGNPSPLQMAPNCDLSGCREVKRLDNTIRSLENQGDTLSMVAPDGAPKRHWWWWLG